MCCFSSSTQEERDNELGVPNVKDVICLKSGRDVIVSSFTAWLFLMCTVPLDAPTYNSFIATFCYKLTHGEIPQVLQDSECV
jgi:UDP-2-acetamido-2,6-beta-L-arabino-hexul-4-ose reductase